MNSVTQKKSRLQWCAVSFTAACFVIGGLVGCGTTSNGASSSGGDAAAKLLRVEFLEGSFEELEVRVVVGVENPTDGNMKIDGAQIKLDVAGQSLSGDGRTADVEPGTRAEYPIRVAWPLPTDPEALDALLETKSVTFKVSGNVTVTGKSYAISGDREMALPEYPTVSVARAQVASQDAGKSGAAFIALGVENPNSFDARLDDFAWGISIAGKVLEPVGTGSTETVPPASTAEFEDTIELNEETFGPEVKALLQQDVVPYVVDGHIVVGGIKRVFQFEGEMAFSR